MKTDNFNKIAAVVSEICEVDLQDILSESRKAEVIEARTILVWQCNRYGFCVNDIAKYVHRKRSKSIYDCLANFHIYNQSSISFRLLVQDVNKKLSETFPKV